MGDAYDISQHYVDPEVRAGLTTEQAEDLHRPEKFGYNELPAVEVSKLWLFLFQFMGTMPYMLELAALVSAAARDWKDFGILLFMLGANGILGFHEEMKCLESLVSALMVLFSYRFCFGYIILRCFLFYLVFLPSRNFVRAIFLPSFHPSNLEIL